MGIEVVEDEALTTALSADDVRWLQGEHSRETNSKRAARGIKRALDIAGSSLGLLLLFPVLLVVSLVVKLTSRGPVLFRQTRVGQHGRNFTFLKFRSMYRNSDSSPHQEYVSHFIAGKAPMKESADGKASAYKLIDDPRVTPFGRFLRLVNPEPPGPAAIILDAFTQFLQLFLAHAR